MQRTLERADAIVRTLERQRRLARPVAAACLLAALAARAGAVPPPAESPQTIFFGANQLYAAERYPEAAAEYERLLAAGVESGNLHFNLGNAYLKAGDVGRAILAYERARRLLPADPDVLANLGYARADAGVTDEPRPWTRLAFPLAERLSTDGLLLLASGLYGLLMLLLIAGRLLPSRPRGPRMVAAVAAVALALVLPSLAYRVLAFDLPSYAVVVAKPEATVRFEPSPGGTVHFRAKPGAELRILGRREGWVEVRRADGLRGWVERAAVATL